MSTNPLNPFDCLPDEIVEYIFLLIVNSPSIESFNHVNISPSSFYFSYILHEPYLRQIFKTFLSLELVCRRFYKLIRSSKFWQQKCHHDHVSIVNESLAISQGIDFRRLYFSNPFHPDYNLLDFNDKKNDRKNHFCNSWVHWEEIPCGCDLLYDVFGQISSCYATSFDWGQYHRDNIQLLRKGEETLISVNPVIEFTVCLAGRRDCPSECKLELCFSDGHIWQYERLFVNGDCQWHRITYRYAAYPKNQMPSHVSLTLKGKDRRYWAGAYGTKFAQIKLRLSLREEHKTENQQLEETLIEPNKSR